MRHQLPQFINIEDKVFGPFTFKQFIYLAGGAGLAYVLWRLLPTIVAVIVVIPVVAFALALAFYKVNNRPFIDTVQAAFTHTLKTKFYLWRRRTVTEEEKKKLAAKVPTPPKSAAEEAEGLSFKESNLRNIAWNLDVLDMADSNATRDQDKLNGQ